MFYSFSALSIYQQTNAPKNLQALLYCRCDTGCYIDHTVIGLGSVVMSVAANKTKVRRPSRSVVPPASVCRDLFQAIVTNNLGKVRKLLDMGVPVDYNHWGQGRFAGGSYSDKTPLMVAASLSRDGVIDALLEYGADVKLTTRDGMNCLMYACARQISDADTIRKLLDLGVSVNSKDVDGNTALAMACKYGNLAAMDVLLASGASVNVMNRYGDSPLDCACRWNTSLQEEYSRSRGVPTLYFLRWSCFTSMIVDFVSRLVHRGADVNKQSGFSGETALHCCLRCPLTSWHKVGHRDVTGVDAAELVTLFVSRGAHLDLPDYDGETVLDMMTRRRGECGSGTETSAATSGGGSNNNPVARMSEEERRGILEKVLPLRLVCLAATAVPVNREQMRTLPAGIQTLICMHKPGGFNLGNI